MNTSCFLRTVVKTTVFYLKLLMLPNFLKPDDFSDKTFQISHIMKEILGKNEYFRSILTVLADFLSKNKFY